MGCTKKICAIVALVCGIIIVILGAVLMVIYDAIFISILLKEMVIAEGTFFYDDLWKEVGTPTYLDYYFYNVTNAQEFLDQDPPGSVKLNVQEIGPYRYREYMGKDKIDILYREYPEQVYFRQKTEIYFEEEMSVGKDTDMITTANIVVASIVPILQYHGVELNRATLLAINKILESNNASLINTRSVHDILYGSQEDEELIKFVKSIEPKATVLDNFGLFMNTNNSKGWYEYQVYTGGDDNIDQLNVITKFKNESTLPYWEGEFCNMINGTDGTSTPPFMEKEDRVYFFVDDVCRSLYGLYEREVDIRGVKGWEIIVPAEIFESPSYNEDNQCFCREETSILCNHDGGISLSTCQAGAPVMVSSPHYLFGDGFYLKMVDGMSPPDKDLHAAVLVYEPITGVAIKADKRLQINLLLMPETLVSIYDPLAKDLVFPVLWVNENGEMSSSDADLLTSLLYDIENSMKTVQIVICIVGAILAVSSFFYLAGFCAYKSCQICCLCSHAVDEKQRNKEGEDNFYYSTESSASESSKEDIKDKGTFQKSTKI